MRLQRYSAPPQPLLPVHWVILRVAAFSNGGGLPLILYFPTMTQDQIKDLKGRAEALRRYL